MKPFQLVAVFALSWLASSCGSGGPETPPATQTVTPLVKPLAPVAKPSLDQLNPLVERQAQEVRRVQEGNLQLRNRVRQQAQNTERLTSLLDQSLAEGQAGKVRLGEIQVLAEAESRLNRELSEVVDSQSDTITELEKTSSELSSEVINLNGVISVANQRLDDTQKQLIDANTNITELSSQKNAAVENASKWKSAADVADGKISLERKWKIRFLFWGAGMSLLAAGYLFLRLNPKTRLFIP